MFLLASWPFFLYIHKNRSVPFVFIFCTSFSIVWVVCRVFTLVCLFFVFFFFFLYSALPHPAEELGAAFFPGVPEAWTAHPLVSAAYTELTPATAAALHGHPTLIQHPALAQVSRTVSWWQECTWSQSMVYGSLIDSCHSPCWSVTPLTHASLYPSSKLKHFCQQESHKIDQCLIA